MALISGGVPGCPFLVLGYYRLLSQGTRGDAPGNTLGSGGIWWVLVGSGRTGSGKEWWDLVASGLEAPGACLLAKLQDDHPVNRMISMDFQ